MYIEDAGWEFFASRADGQASQYGDWCRYVQIPDQSKLQRGRMMRTRVKMATGKPKHQKGKLNFHLDSVRCFLYLVMVSETWLDAAAGFAASFTDRLAGRTISGQLQAATASFSPEQTAILQQAFAECFKVFAEKVNDRFTMIEERLLCDTPRVGLQNETRNDYSCGQGEVFTVLGEDTSPSATKRKNLLRKLRRKKAKEKYSVQRNTMLRLRSLVDVSGTDQAPEPPISIRSEFDRIQGQVDNLEVWAYNLHQFLAPAQLDYPLQEDDQSICLSGVPASFLAMQSQAAITIQRAWKRRRPLDYLDILLNEVALANAQSVEVISDGCCQNAAEFDMGLIRSSGSLRDEPLLGMHFFSVGDGVRLRSVSTWHGGFFTAFLDSTCDCRMEGMEEDEEDGAGMYQYSAELL